MRTKPFLARALLVLLPFVTAPTPVGAAEDIQLLLTTESGATTTARDVDIFYNDNLQDRVLHPGSQGTFEFTITNPEDFDVDFRLAVTEENLHGVPIEYCLQTEGHTILEDGEAWMSAEELADHEERLTAGGTREMVLHWRWLFTVDEARDAADTRLGGHEEATAQGAYTLLLDIYAEQSEPAATGDGFTGGKAQGGKATGRTGKNNSPPSTFVGGGAPKRLDIAKTGDTAQKHVLPALFFGASVSAILLVALRHHIASPQRKRRNPHGKKPY